VEDGAADPATLEVLVEAAHHLMVVQADLLSNQGKQILDIQLMLDTQVYLEAMPLVDQELDSILAEVAVVLVLLQPEDKVV
jgi:hypothetical protein